MRSLPLPLSLARRSRTVELTPHAHRTQVYGFRRLSAAELVARVDIDTTDGFSAWSHPDFTRDDKSTLHRMTPRPSRARQLKKAKKEALGHMPSSSSPGSTRPYAPLPFSSSYVATSPSAPLSSGSSFFALVPPTSEATSSSNALGLLRGAPARSLAPNSTHDGLPPGP